MSSIDKSLTYIDYNGLSIFISETPTDSQIRMFISKLHKRDIKHVVRLCGNTYDKTPIVEQGIKFYDWNISDSCCPTSYVLDKWMDLIKLNEPILIHCITGLGRSPIIVAVGLIEKKMDCIDAIELIRSKRPYSLNSIQINWLFEYKPKKKSLLRKFFRLQ
jgi:protein tyrosine phosphatase type 4A